MTQSPCVWTTQLPVPGQTATPRSRLQPEHQRSAMVLRARRCLRPAVCDRRPLLRSATSRGTTLPEGASSSAGSPHRGPKVARERPGQRAFGSSATSGSLLIGASSPLARGRAFREATIARSRASENRRIQVIPAAESTQSPAGGAGASSRKALKNRPLPPLHEDRRHLDRPLLSEHFGGLPRPVRGPGLAAPLTHLPKGLDWWSACVLPSARSRWKRG